MTKRETIDQIIARNKSARAEFLAEFDEDALGAYLRQLKSIDSPLRREVIADTPTEHHHASLPWPSH